MEDILEGPSRPHMCVEVRPNFGNSQVRTADEIVEGATYIKHYRTGGKRRMKVINSPHKNDEGRWWMDVEYMGGPLDGKQYEESLADAGVVPYESGLWNPTNWLERVD